MLLQKKVNKYSVFFYAFAVVLAALIVQVNTACASTAPVIVVVLSNFDVSPYHQLETAFKKNLLQKYPGAEVSVALLAKDKAERTAVLNTVRKKKPNMILALGTSSIHEALKEFPNTPIVASMVMNNKAFAHADEVTGVLLQVSPEIHFQWLKRFLPNKKQVGVLYNSRESKQWIDDAFKEAGHFGLRIVAVEMDSAKDLPHALKEINRKADVLIGIPDQTVYSGKTAKMVLLATFRSKTPFIGISKPWVKAGALYGLEWDYGEVGRHCASIADKILSGTAAGDIPVQTMTGNARYTVNMRTARHLKLDIDPAILDGAAFIFE